MTKIEFQGIISQKNNLKNLPNGVLENYLAKLSEDFEATKQNIIGMTHHLDNVEELYNFILKEFENRNNE